LTKLKLCNKCTKAKIPCQGYEDDAGIHSRKNKGLVAQNSVSPQPSLNSGILEDIDPGGLVLSSFIADCCIFPDHPGLSRGYLDGLDVLVFPDSKLHADITQAAKIVAFASFGIKCGRPSFKQRARVMYVDMLRSTRNTISKGSTKNGSELLVIMILLGIYEMIACTDDNLSSQASHTSGVYGLLTFENNTIGLVEPAKRQKISAPLYLQKSTVVSDRSGILIAPDMNPSVQLLNSLVLKHQTLLDRSNLLLNSHTTPGEDLRDILQEAKLLNQEFSLWPESQLEEWALTNVGFVDPNRDASTAELTWISGRVDKYMNLIVAATWNKYRIYSLLLLDAIIRISDRLEVTDNCRTEKAKAQGIIDDVMASLPFHLLRDETRFVTELEIMPGSLIGGLSIMHPLFLLTNLPVVPPHQQAQTRECLAWIGEHLGIREATSLSAVRYKSKMNPKLTNDINSKQLRFRLNKSQTNILFFGLEHYLLDLNMIPLPARHKYEVIIHSL
jgi:hypothetical protein